MHLLKLSLRNAARSPARSAMTVVAVARQPAGFRHPARRERWLDGAGGADTGPSRPRAPRDACPSTAWMTSPPRPGSSECSAPAGPASRMRRIDVLGALGFDRREILVAFIVESVALSLIGTALGLSLALTLVEFAVGNSAAYGSEVRFRSSPARPSWRAARSRACARGPRGIVPGASGVAHRSTPRAAHMSREPQGPASATLRSSARPCDTRSPGFQSDGRRCHPRAHRRWCARSRRSASG